MQPKPKPKAKAKKPSKRLEKTYEYFDGMNENTKAIAKLTARMKDFEERLNNLGQHAGRMHIDICNHEKRLAALEGKPAPELPSEKPK